MNVLQDEVAPRQIDQFLSLICTEPVLKLVEHKSGYRSTSTETCLNEIRTNEIMTE